MTKSREYFVSEPPGKATSCVIWLHGLGADGNDFAGIMDQVGLPDDHGVRFIFPSAPFINITINNGMLMRGWYDILNLDIAGEEDELGLNKSRALISEYIAEAIAQGIACDKIILAGFSQGGAISLYTALQSTQKLGGVIVLSAYLPLQNSFSTPTPITKDIPIFMAHGLFDPVVPYNLGLETYNFLHQHNYAVQWYSYPMQHTLCLEEIAEIGTFIRRCLGYA